MVSAILSNTFQKGQSHMLFVTDLKPILGKVIPANSEYRVILNSSDKMIHDYKSTDRCTTVLDTQVGVGGSFHSEPSLGARVAASWCKVMNCALHQLLTQPLTWRNFTKFLKRRCTLR